MHRLLLSVLVAWVLAWVAAPASGEQPPRTPSREERVQYLIKKGHHLRGQRDWEKAVQTYTQVLKLDKGNVAAHLGLGWTRNDQKKYQSAYPWFKMALQLDPKCAQAYHGMGFACIAEKNDSEAAFDYTKAIQLDPSKAFYFSNRAIAYSSLGKHDRAIADYSEAIKLEPNDARYYNNRGDSYREKKNYPLALNDLNQAIRLDPTQALTYRARSEVHAALGNMKQAEADMQTFEQLERDRKEMEVNYFRVKELHERYRFREAIEPAKKALALSHKTRPPNDLEIARLLDLLAQCYDNSGLFGEAEPLYEKSLRMFMRLNGKNDIEVVSETRSLGTLYLKLGRPDKAKVLFRRALHIAESEDGFESTVASCLNDLAVIHEALGDQEKDAELLRRAQRLIEPFEPDSPLLATILANRADRLGPNQDRLAESLLQRALKIRRTTSFLFSLGHLRLSQGRLKDAETYFQEVFAIEKKSDSDPSLMALSLSSLAFLHGVQKRWEEAGKEFDQCNRLHRRYYTDVLYSLSDKEQLNFLQRGNYQAGWHEGLSLALSRRADAKLAALSANWVLNRKAVAREVLANRILLSRSSEGQQANLARQLAEQRAELAHLINTPPRSEETGQHEAKVKKATEQAEKLAKKFAQAIQRPTDVAPWIECEQVRARLPKNSVLIEFVKFHRAEFNVRRVGLEVLEPTREENFWYAAWVIPAAQAGAVQLVDLGSAAEIDRAVEALQKDLRKIEEKINSNPLNINELKWPEREQQFRRQLDTLVRLLLKPLLGQTDVGKIERWLISPDAHLWLVPWAALPLPDRCYAVERHTISLATTGRELLNPLSKALGKQRPLVLLDPDYGEANTASRFWFSPLPWYREEIEQVSSLLKGFTRAEPIVQKGGEARKAAFQLARNPTAVFVCTHGFSREDEETRKAIPDPLLRCGLALAGANRHAASGTDDGIISGLEVVGIDLRGTELVLLDACQTARGEIRTGEGVASLTHAFQLAGAHAVVSTLWEVPHRLPLAKQTSLTTRFLDKLRACDGKAEALRAAQRSLIDELRSEHRSAHPFLWAAYTFTGG